MPESEEREPARHPTSFLESFIHLLKGNMGSGMFAMGDAFKHAGLVGGPIWNFLLGFLCIYNDHILINCSDKVRTEKTSPNFPDTVALSFQAGPPPFRRLTSLSRSAVKLFVMINQLGCCCVYFVFVSSTLKNVADGHGYIYDRRWFMGIMLIPVIFCCFIKSLKYLAPVSLLANLCVSSSIILTLYLSSRQLPPVSSRKLFADLSDFPVYFGIAMYAFQGISLVLPLKLNMKHPEQFNQPCGVLNLGLTLVIFLLNAMGVVGYLKFGDDVLGSLSLNLPTGDLLSEGVQITISLGIIFSYALQFYIAGELIWNEVDARFGPFKAPAVMQRLIKAVLVTSTMIVAAVVPHLGLFISLIGAFSSTALALLFPPLCDISLRLAPEKRYRFQSSYQWLRIVIDCVTLVVACLGVTVGTYISLQRIIHVFSTDFN